jgi:hypothetical protein
MTSYPVRLLCLVDEQALLHCRRAVLKSPGYDAQTARLSEVKLLLRIGKKFDLVIVSAGSSESQVGRILSAAGETSNFVLGGAKLSRGIAGASGTAAGAYRSADVGEVTQCQNGNSKTGKMMRVHISSASATVFRLGLRHVLLLLLPFINLGIGTRQGSGTRFGGGAFD